MKKGFFRHHFLFCLMMGLMVLICGCVTQTYAAEQEASQNLLPDPDFKKPGQWSMPKGYSLVPGAGRNGKTALMLEKDDPNYYPLCTTSVKVKPGGIYEFGVYIKGENVKGNSTISAEYHNKKGEFVPGGSYPNGPGGTFDWTLVSAKTYVPDNIDACTITLAFRPDSSGKIWFSEPFVREAGSEFDAYVLEPAMPTRIPVGKSDVIFGVIPPNNEVYESCRVTMMRGDHVLADTVGKVVKNRVEVRMDIPLGDFNFRLMLQKKGKPVGEVDLPVSGATKEMIDNAPVRIDERGRTIVNGKKFFPVGIYMNNIDPRCTEQEPVRAALATIAKAKFNCIMAYDAPYWNDVKGAQPNIEAIRKVLDYIDSLGLKVIYSLKDIRGDYGFKRANGETIHGEKNVIKMYIDSLKDHPAILAWYINDEDNISFRKEFIDRNQFINKLDPDHPTWASFAEFNHLTPRYGGSATVYALAPYSVANWTTGDVKHQKMGLDAMNAAEKSFAHRKGMAFWMVPQIFNWGVYFPDKWEKFRYPTDTEMRSMMMLSLVRGAKGVIMYSYFDLFAKPDGKAQFEKRWPEIKELADLLLSLEGYILGDPAAPEMSVQVQAGQVQAAGFSDDAGKHAVIIAAIGPGESKARIVVESKQKLKSLYGRTVQQADGSWLFTGQDVDSDVLMPQ